MKIDEIFSTADRVSILRATIYRRGALGVSGVAEETGLSKGLVSKYLRIMARNGILKRHGSKFAVSNSVAARAARLMLNLSMLDERLFTGFGFVKGAGIYGSFAKGSNDEASDIDMWVMIERASGEELARLTARLRNSIGDVKPLYLTKDKLRLLKRNDELFYHSLVFGSITIFGDDIETV